MTVTGGNRIVVTGANRGIGYHMTAALLEGEYRVAALDVEGENLRGLQEEYPDRVRYFECDVAESDDVDGAIAEVLEDWGAIDVLVNNAAIATVGSFADGSIDDLRRLLEVNFLGYARTIHAILPHMRARDAGIVHNVCSGAARLGHPGLTGYAATKGAIEAFVRSLRFELREENVACTLMYPPSTATGMTTAFEYPDWMLNDPADVGRKLAGEIESTEPVVYPDVQTRLGLALMTRFPFLWRRTMERSVTLEG